MPRSTKSRIALTVQTLFLSSVIGAIAITPTAELYAAEVSRVVYDVPAGSLEDALNAFAKQSGVTLSFDPALVKGKSAPAINGENSQDEALSKLLKGSGLEPVTKDGAVVIKPVPVTSQIDTLPEVSVKANVEADPNELPAPYAGGQVARGGLVGMLGNRDVFDTPFNVQNLTEQTIRNQQPQSLTDVVIFDPSVRATYARGSGRDEFVIRGFYLDTRDITFNGLYGVIPDTSVAIDFAERVEIFKGPTALLNGQSPAGAVGGSINIVPKRATATPITRLTTTYISDTQLGGNIDVGRRFNVGEGSIGIRVNGAYRSGDTAVDNRSQQQGLGSIGVDYSDLNTRVSLDLANQQVNIKGFQQGILVLASSVPSAPDNKTNNTPPWTYRDTNYTFGAARIEKDIMQNLTFFAAVGGKSGDTDFENNNATILDDAGNLRTRRAKSDSEVRTVSTEVGARWLFDTGFVNHDMTLKFNNFHNTQAGRSVGGGILVGGNLYDNLNTPKPVFGPYTNTFSEKLRLSSTAFSDVLSVFDRRLQLVVGLRKQRVRLNSDTSYDESAMTPSIGFIVKPIQNVALYGNYIQGLQPGPIAPNDGTVSNPGQVFTPAKTRQYEVGVKWDLSRLAFTTSLFQIEQPSQYIDPITTEFSVNGKQRNSGIEINVFGELLPNLRVLGGTAYTIAKTVKTDNPAFKNRAAAGVPRTYTNLGFETDINAVPGLTLTALYIYTGKQFYEGDETLEIPSWQRFDIGARYRTKLNSIPVTMRLNIENVADRSYWATANAGLYAGGPRAAVLSATFDF